MAKGKYISSDKVAQMVAYREEGVSQQEIGTRLGVCQSVVSRCLARYDVTHSFSHRTLPGKQRVTSARTDGMIKRIVVANPTASSSFIASQLPPEVTVSTRTIRRRLQIDHKLRAYRPSCTPRLSAKNIKDRLTFAKKYGKWTKEQWQQVMFSDESLIKQFYSFSTHIRRPVGQRYNLKYTVPRVKNSPSQMIWGSISAAGRGALWFMPPDTTINAKVYLSILKDKLPNFMAIHKCSKFQHDGAPCHSAKTVTKWIQEQGFELIHPWPGSSPDLNPIENCWAILKKKIALLKPTSAADLQMKIKLAWCQHITHDYCRNLIDSMPDRIAAVVAAKGGATKY